MPDIGTVFPAYYIATVIYMPPGVSSSVDYGAGSTIGTTTSVTQSFKADVSVQLSGSGEFLGLKGGIDISFGSVFSNATTTQTDVQESINADMKVNGVPGDAVNHDYDQIVLLLGPQVTVTSFPSAPPRQVQWAMNLSGTIPQVVLVGWLKGTMPMPSNVAATLSQYGVTPPEYPAILLADPFANDTSGMTAPDPRRFQQVTKLPYEPISGQYSYKTNNNYTSSTTQTASIDITVGATASGSFENLGFKDASKFTWTFSGSNKVALGDSENETLVVSMPSAGYTGPTDLYVYVDKVFKTFLFSFKSQ
jgi:hypothetical protein